jgi:hypothetical protein
MFYWRRALLELISLNQAPITYFFQLYSLADVYLDISKTT